MSTFFPTIEELASISDFNYRYAEAILKILMAKVLKLAEIDVGI